MGSDITCYIERKNKDGKWECLYQFEGWEDRSYLLYGFLCDLRNYYGVPVISPERGLPEDVSSKVKDECCEDFGYNRSYLTIEELLQFNFNTLFFHMVEKKVYTLKESLEDDIMKGFEDLFLNHPNDRIVFWFT